VSENIKDREVKNLDFHRLEAFVAVAAQRSFSRAAAQLFLSQPTVSAHVKSLEKELGVALFDRGKQEFSLTSAGEALYRYAKDLLDLRTRALHEITESAAVGREELTVIASSVPCQYLLPQAVAAFVRQFPDLSVSLRQKNSCQACADVFQYHYPLGVVGEKYLLDKLQYLPLLRDELVVAIPTHAEYRALLAKEKVSVTDLTDYRLLLREPGSATRALLENALTRAGFGLEQFRLTVFDSQETIKQAVRRGLGCSVISRYVVEDYRHFGLLEVREFADLVLEREFYLVYHEQRVLSPATKALREFLAEFFQKEA